MPKYLVVEHPGFPGPQGFVRPGGVVELPSDAIPSRFFHPLDQEAYAILKETKAKYVEDLERRMSEVEHPRKLSKRERDEYLFVPEPPATPEAAEEVAKKASGEDPDAGHTLSEINRMNERANTEAPVPAAGAKKSGRAADR